MIKLKVLELLKKKGHTKYWLYKQLGMSYQNFSKMVNNQTKSIRYENIETICLLLECTPNELFEITEEQKSGSSEPLFLYAFLSPDISWIS